MKYICAVISVWSLTIWIVYVRGARLHIGLHFVFQTDKFKMRFWKATVVVETLGNQFG